MEKMKMPIMLDDENTWPDETQQALKDKLNLFKKYITHENKEDRRIEIDPPPSASVFRESNPFEKEWNDAPAEILASLSNSRIVAYHCSRFHQEEIKTVLSKGLATLTLELVANRINARCREGDLPNDVAERIIYKNLAEEKFRKNMTHFTLKRKDLQWEVGNWRLFEFWGGEAIYAPYIEGKNKRIENILRSIGTPCIVVAAIPVTQFRRPRSVAKGLRHQFLISHGLKNNDIFSPEAIVLNDVSAKDILRIVQLKDPEFEKLTRCSTWSIAPSV